MTADDTSGVQMEYTMAEQRVREKEAKAMKRRMAVHEAWQSVKQPKSNPPAATA